MSTANLAVFTAYPSRLVKKSLKNTKENLVLIILFYDMVPYGLRMRTDLVIPILLKKVFNGEPITIAGDGS